MGSTVRPLKSVTSSTVFKENTRMSKERQCQCVGRKLFHLIHCQKDPSRSHSHHSQKEHSPERHAFSSTQESFWQTKPNNGRFTSWFAKRGLFVNSGKSVQFAIFFLFVKFKHSEFTKKTLCANRLANQSLLRLFCSVSRREGHNKGGRKQMRANASIRRGENADKRKQTQRRKRKQTQANASKRGQTQTSAYTPVYCGFLQPPLCNPLICRNNS